jgi:ribosome-associated translation inhibitor RaiA
MQPSDSILEHVRRRAMKLDTFNSRLMSCRVAVAAPHRHRTHGKRYHVRIDMTVPRGELVVDRLSNDAIVREDLHAVVDATFDQAERLLREHTKRRLAVQRHGSASTVRPVPIPKGL